jgi:muramidase (phage lysozyme)
MAVESPNRSTISPLRFFNRTARVNQQGPTLAKERLTQINGSLKRILSVKEKTIDTSKIEEEQYQRQEKEKKLEAGKFFVRGVGKLANAIPGKNTIQRFLLFMAFGWLFNTFSKYFGELSGPLSSIIGTSAKVIDAFSKIAFGIFNGFATFIDIGYKTWDVIRGTEDSQKLQGALNDVILGIDSFFGGILSLLGIVERPPEEQQAPQMQPGTSGSTGSADSGSGAPPSAGNLPRVPQQGQAPPSSSPTPQAPPAQVSGGIIPSQARITSGYGSQESFRKGPHSGIDYGYDVGTPISLIKGGIVVEASTGYNGGYGNFVLIRHSDGKYSMFNHLDKIYVQKGQKISGSQGNAPVIGTIGNSGFSTGSHLDYKVATKWDGYNPGGFINPTSYQDSVFRIGSDVKVKPSQVQKLAKQNGKEGVMVDGKWRAKPWTNDEKERYSRVSGEQKEESEQLKSTPGGSNRYGTQSQKAILDTIAFAEGNTGYSTWAGYQKHGPDDLTGLTIRQIHDLQTSFISSGKVNVTGSAVVGRYQFLNPLNQARAAGLNPEVDKFTPANQDKMAIHILNTLGVTDDRLKREGLSVGIADQIATQWASFPYSPKGGRSYYGQGYKDLEKLKQIYGTKLNQIQPQSSAKPTPTSQASSQASAQAAQEYAASKGKYYSSTTGKTYGSYSEALKDPEVKKSTKPQRWATDPRGWFGMRDGGIVGEIPKQTKATDISSLESYPSYSPESGESMKVAIQPVIIKVPTPSGGNNSTDFPVATGVNNSMSNTSKLYA